MHKSNSRNSADLFLGDQPLDQGMELKPTGDRNHPLGNMAGQQSLGTLRGSGTKPFLEARETRAFQGAPESLGTARAHCLSACKLTFTVSLRSSQAARTVLGEGDRAAQWKVPPGRGRVWERAERGAVPGPS